MMVVARRRSLWTITTVIRTFDFCLLTIIIDDSEYSQLQLQCLLKEQCHLFLVSLGVAKKQI